MSTSRDKKQKRILYFCFVILLIAAAVAAAVAGAYKKSEKGRAPIGTETAETETADTAAEPTAGRKDGGTKETEKEEAGLIPARPKRETEETKTERTETEPASLTPEPITFRAPVSGSVYAEFSVAVPVFSNTMNDYRTHAGVDVSAEIGDPVYACADGVIDDVYEDPMMGQTVKISHADGFESVYRNLSAVLPEGIEKGASVRAGQMIGAVGDTALIECEDEPHLHFELLLTGEPVDPSLHVSFTPPESDYEG
ncbi:MAG: M23 family metallopeptidase [Clostridia bacterium]|nr:M23 family metallopeptidase [Clostridia bacterium]